MFPSARGAGWSPTCTSSAGRRLANGTRFPREPCLEPIPSTRAFPARGVIYESATAVSDENYIMGSGHIAHDGKIGNRTVIASCALIAGYVEVEDQAFISGGVVVHQFSR